MARVIGALAETAISNLLGAVTNLLKEKADVILNANDDLKNLQEKLKFYQKDIIEEYRSKIEVTKKDNGSTSTNKGEVENTLMSGAMGSKILITSRNIDVSRGIGALYMHRLPILTEDESWNLFLNKAYKTEDELKKHKLHDIAKKIVKKCSGFPLVVQTVGSLMQTKSMKKAEWKVVVDSAIWEWKMPSSSPYSPILLGLILSYEDLPRYLGSCFVYCSIFPKDHEIKREGLIMQWVAHGLIEEKEGVGVEVTANQYIEDLIRRCLIEETHDRFYGGTYLQLHDILHDLASYIGGKEYSHASAAEHTRHLSLLGVDDAEAHVQCNASGATNKMRTLLLSEYSSSVEFTNFKWLRVLSLRGSQMDELPNSIELLLLLKYLDLSWSEVRQLPRSIGKLRNLQTLDLSYSKIEELPEEMGELCNLRYLGLERTQNLQFVAEGLGRLTNLWTLHRFMVCDDKGDTGGCNIRELKDLNKLKGELLIEGLGGGRVKVIDAERAQLREKHELIGVKLEFKLRWDYQVDSASEVGEDDKVDSVYEVGEDDKVDRASEVGEDDKVDSASEQKGLIEALEPPHDIERLGIFYYKGGRPSWYLDTNYVELRTLQLRCCPLLATVIGIKSMKKLEVYGSTMLKTLVNMPALESLKLRFCGSLEQIAEMPSLRSLEVGGSTMLKTLANMPALESLKVRDCGSLEQVAEMPALRSLEVGGSTLLKTLANMLALESLKVRDCGSLQQVAEMPALTSMEVGGSTMLKTLVDLPALESLKVIGCGSLEQVAEMPALRSLEVGGSTMLKTLANMPVLESLKVRDCGNLEQVAEMPALRSLEVGGSTMLKTLANIPALESSEVRDCSSLEQVAEMPARRSLKVYKCNMIKILANMPALESLEIGCCDSLEKVAEIPALSSLEVRGCNMLKTLTNILALESLMVDECGSLEKVAEMPAVKSLNVNRCNMLKTLANMPSLESLDVADCDSLEQVVEMSALRSLQVGNCNMLKTLTNMPGLESLHVVDCDSLEQVTEMPALNSLVAYRCNMLKTLANMPALKSLQVESIGLKTLASMPALESLDVSNCDVLEQVAEMPALTSLCVFVSNMLKTLANMPALDWLVVRYCDSLEQVAEMPALRSLEGLESLHVSDCNSLEQVAEIPALKSLDVFGYFTLENMLETPANIPALESLKVSGNILLKILASMPSLGSLTLNYCRALEQVVEMPTLRSLEVVGCTSLKTLAHMPNLIDLKLDGADEATFLPSLKCLSHLEELRLKRFTEDISLGGLWQCIPKLKELWLIDLTNLKSLVSPNFLSSPSSQLGLFAAQDYGGRGGPPGPWPGFGVPHDIVSDNGTHFKNEKMKQLCSKYHITHHFSAPYYPQGNGQAETTNKILIRILEQTVETGRDWHEKMHNALWAYRTTMRTPTNATSAELVYGTEVVLPLHVLKLALKFASLIELPLTQYQQKRLMQLDLLDEKRLNMLKLIAKG
ncbi:putative disease resistance RPP13-like protein 1 [Nymphaea thermarum]|nr:putative disease resistance RPP13-like protein 1 [Nymphaea thermarum]